MYKNILIPTDGTEFSEKAVNVGIELAKQLGAKVTGIHIYPSFHFHPDAAYVVSDVRSRQELSEVAKSKGESLLSQLQTSVKAAGLNFESVLIQDDQVWKEILNTATEKGCDLIVMAAHGRRGLAALMLGSETNKVLTHSKIPVLVCR